MSLDKLRSITKRTRGPRGSCTVLQARPGAGALTVTSCSERLFNLLTFREDPPTRTLVLLSQSQIRTYGDGGLLAAFIASDLVISGKETPFCSADMVKVAQDWCPAILMDSRCLVSSPVAPTDLKVLLAVCSGVISPKSTVCRLFGDDARLISIQVLRAFLSTASAFSGGTSINQLDAFVRIQPVLGPPANASLCLEQCVVLDLPWPAGMPQKPIEDVKIALFNTSISIEVSDTPSIGKIEGFSAPNVLNAICDQVLALGVGILASQRTIDDLVVDRLKQSGVMVLPRLSIRHIEAVRRISGASVMSALNIESTGKLGHIDRIYLEKFGSRSLIVLENINNTTDPVSTLVLCGPDSHAVDELEHVSKCALRVLKHAIMGIKPRVCASGGCTEVYLATELRKRAKYGHAGHVLGSTLERVAGALSHDSSSSWSVIDEIKQGDLLGWDGCGVSTIASRTSGLSGDVLDLVAVKLAAILQAVEAACAVLRVGGVV